MSYAGVHEAVTARLLDNWVDTPVMTDGGVMVDPVSRETVEQPSGAPWVRLTVQEAGEVPIGKGSKTLWRSAGRVVVDVFTPEDSPRRGRSMADQIAALFRGKSFGGVTFTEAPVRGIGQVDGLYQTQVAAQYRADFEA